MKIEKLIQDLQELQKLYPNAIIYFTDVMYGGTWETYFQGFNVDEEDNSIEMLFDTEGEV